MTDYRPVSDYEWNWLTRRFAALERLPGMREMFDRSLTGSPYPASERRQFRREIYQAVRSMASPGEAYANPYFELTWIRAVEDNPTLLQDVARNRSLLWNAYFRAEEPPGFREQQIDKWKEVAGEHVELVIVTDEELAEGEPAEL